MQDDTFASFARRLDTFANGLKNPELERVMKAVGQAAEKDAERAASADLGGDPAFSGWIRSPLRTELKHPGEGKVEVRPTGKARGPWRVAEDGRNAGGGVGAFQGPGVNRSTGLTMRTRSGKIRNSRARARRYNGRTKPKHTWSDAVEVIERETPKRLDAEVKKAIRKAFGG